MGSVEPTLVDLQQIGKTTELRIDAHYFSLLDPIQKITQTIIEKIPLTAPPFGRIQNGINLPETAYEIDQDDPAYRYVSVGAISQFALRPDRATPLRSPDDYAYEVDLQSIACREDEVLLTRSGTPGVAWPVTSNIGEGPCLIPSGFVIRAQCPPGILDAHYVAAVLNHPVWRVWSAGLAAGKRQRNLSHDHLAQIFLPALPYPEQVKIGERYRSCLANIERLLSENPSIRADCDSVLRDHLSVSINSLEVGAFSFDTVSILACANSPIIRMDSRFHRSEVRAVVAPLDSVPHTSLVQLQSRL